MLSRPGLICEYRNLLSNPFNCNCHLEWLSSWLRTKTLMTTNPRCFYPERFREMSLTELKLSDFKCERTCSGSKGIAGIIPLRPAVRLMMKSKSSTKLRTVERLFLSLRCLIIAMPTSCWKFHCMSNNMRWIMEDGIYLLCYPHISVVNNEVGCLPGPPPCCASELGEIANTGNGLILFI